MNREEYIKVLNNQLRHLPKEDRDKALEYFIEYFEDAGVENEQQAIENLGDPKSAADQIICELAVKNSKESIKEKSVKKGMKGIWIGILAAFATPFAIPMILALVLLILALILTVFCFLLAFFFVGGSLVLTCPAVFVAGITMISQSSAVTLICIGTTGVMLGIGLIIIYSAYLWLIHFINGIVKLFGKLAGRGIKNNEK